MSAPSQARAVLRQIAAIKVMEPGKLCLLRRGPTGPYYNHQTWEKGRNVCRYVPREQAAALRQAIAGYRRFQKLMAQYVELMAKQSRAKRSLGGKK